MTMWVWIRESKREMTGVKCLVKWGLRTGEDRKVCVSSPGERDSGVRDGRDTEGCLL